MALDGQATFTIRIDASQSVEGLKELSRTAEQVKGEIDSSLGGGFSSAAANIAAAGGELTNLITKPVMEAGAWGAGIAMNFEEGMSQVKAITKASGEDFENLRGLAMQLGEDTKFSSQEVADGMVIMAKAGWDTNYIMSGMSGVLDAAAASGEDLARVSEVMANTINGFGLEASDATRVADVLTETANAGTVDITDLGESFKYCASSCQNLGIPLEEAATAMLVFSNYGIKGSQAGTTLRRILANLSGQSDAANEALQALGYSAYDEQGNFKGLNTVLSELRPIFAGMTEEEKQYYAGKIAGMTGVSGFLALINQETDSYEDLTKQMYDCGGVAQDTAEVMQDNLANQIEMLTGSLETTAIKLGELLIPKIREFVEWLNQMIDKFNALPPEQQKMVLGFVGVAAAIGPVMSVLGGVVGTISTIGKGFASIPQYIGGFTGAFGKVGEAIGKFVGKAGAGSPLAGALENLKVNLAGHMPNALSGLLGPIDGLGNALAFLTSPLGILTVGIGALVAAFIYLWTTSEDFRNSIIAVFDQISTRFENFWNLARPTLEELWQALQNIWENILKPIWDWLCENILGPFLVEFFEFIGGAIDGLLTAIQGILDFLVGVFSGDWGRVWDGVREVFKGVCDVIGSLVQNIIDFFAGLLDDLWNGFVAGWNEACQALGDTITGVWDLIVQGWNDFWAQILQGIVDWWDNTVQPKLDEAAAFFSGIWEGIKTAWNAVLEFVGNFFSGIVNSFTDWINWVAETTAGFFTNILTWITEGLGNILKAIGDWVIDFLFDVASIPEDTKNTIIEGFNGAIDWLVNIGSDIIEGFWNGITGAISWVTDGISGFVDDVIGIFTGGFKIGSPSKVMADDVGQYIPMGIVEGVNDGMSNATVATNQAIMQWANSAAMAGQQAGQMIRQVITQSFADAGIWLVDAGNAAINGFCDAIVQSGPNVQAVIIQWAQGVNQSFTQACMMIKSSVLQVFADSGTWLAQAGANVVMGFCQGITNSTANAQTTITQWTMNVNMMFNRACVTVHDTIIQAFAQAPQWLVQIGQNVILGFCQGVSGAIPQSVALVQNWGNTINHALQQACNSIHMTVTASFADAGNWLVKPGAALVEGFTTAVKGSTPAAVKSVSDWGSAIKDIAAKACTEFKNVIKNAFSDAGNWLVQSGRDMANGLSEGIGQGQSGIGDTVNRVIFYAKDKIRNGCTDIYNTIINYFRNSGDWLYVSGRNMSVGFANGIADAAPAVYRSVASMTRNTIARARAEAGIRSPSKVMANEVGKWLPLGIAAGFDAAAPGAVDDMGHTLKSELNHMDTPTVDIETNMVADFWDRGDEWKRDLLNGFGVFETSMSGLVDKLMSGVLDYSSMAEQITKTVGPSLTTPHTAVYDPMAANPNTQFTIDYARLAEELAGVLRDAPVEPKVDVYMQDGDVLMDSERVGRALAPVMSRMMVGGDQPLPADMRL